MKKRKDGRYCKQVLLGYTTEGRPKYKNFYGYSQKEVERDALLFKNDLEKGIAIIEDNISLNDWAKRWLELYKNNVEYNTLQMYNNTVNNHILPALGRTKLKDIKKHHIQELINRLISDGKERTAGIVKLTLSQILEQAVENEYVYKNVAKSVILPEVNKSPKRALTEIEKDYIKNTDFTVQEKAFVFLLLYSGLRRGEALALMKNDIDLKNNVIKVNKTVIFKGNDAEIKQPKTKAGNREIPILKELKPSLIEQMKGSDGIYLFTDTRGGIMSKSSFRRFWDGIMDKLNTAAGGQNYNSRDKNKTKIIAIASDITPHMFRHTYATTLYYAGVDIKTAQYLLGHSNIQVTLDIYTHLDKSKINDTADRLNEFLNPSENKKSVKNPSINK